MPRNTVDFLDSHLATPFGDQEPVRQPHLAPTAGGAAPPAPGDGVDDARITAARLAIEQHLAEPLDIDALASLRRPDVLEGILPGAVSTDVPEPSTQAAADTTVEPAPDAFAPDDNQHAL